IGLEKRFGMQVELTIKCP
ncbi:uncharacterized, partial [Tachysurus ichikawai]